MSTVIDILRSNRLYDEHGTDTVIDNNKTSEFLNTYKYNGTKKHPFPKNITRDSNGNILLDEIPYIVSNVDTLGDNMPFWILLNNGSKILIKDFSKEKIELELLIMYFLKELDISCAKYDKVLINNKEYLASNSFLRNNEEINFVLLDNDLNIEDNLMETAKYNADVFYLKTILVDRLYGNTDRSANFGIITGSYLRGKPAPPRIAPLFDTADHILRKKCNPMRRFPGINDDYELSTVITYLLKYEFMENFMRKKLKDMNLEKCATLLEQEKGIIVSCDKDSGYEKLKSYFEDSEKEINDILKSNGNSFRIKLV